MKPVSIKLQAFGPYLEEQYIDFTDFYASNLFLIHGETGSGKTAILDAITYALYGKSSGGGRGDISQMRCDRADNKTETIVEYEFIVRDNLYKFIRNIKCTSGGKLNVSQNALIKRGGVFVQLGENDKQTTVNNEAERVIGLNYEQFRQVIILPQGQFENFLVAKSEVKETILNTLFNAEKWSKITGILWDRSRLTEQSIKSEENMISSKLKEYKCENIEEFGNHIANVEATSVLVDDTIEKLKIKQSESQKELENAKNINGMFAKLKEEKEKLNQLTAIEKGIDEKRRQYADILKAEKIKPIYLSFINAENRYRQRFEDLKNTEKQYIIAREKYNRINDELNKIKSENAVYESNSVLLMKYNSMVDLYKKFEIRRLEAIEIKREYYNIAKIAENDKKNLQDKINLRKELSDKREYIITHYSTMLPGLRLQIEELNKSRKLISTRDKAFEEIKNYNNKLTDKNNLLEINQENLNRRKDEYNKEYNVYISNTAALLAENLTDGEPCPVCGSVNHPSPHVGIETGSENITTEQLNLLNDKITAAMDNINAITSEIEKTNIRLQTLNESVCELESAIKESMPFTQVALTESELRLQQAETECGKLKHISDEINAFDKEITGLDESLKNHVPKIEELREKDIAYIADCRAMKQQMDDSIPDSGVLAERISKITADMKRYESILQSAELALSESESLCDRYDENLKLNKIELTRAESELSETKSEYEIALHTEKFENTEQFKNTLENSKSADPLDNEIKEYDKLYFNLTVNIRQIEESLKDKSAFDIDSMTADYDKITNDLNENISKQGLYRNTVTECKKQFNELEKRIVDLTVRRKKFEKLNTFAASLNGVRGIGLSRYVLGVMLSAVIHEANVLLQNVHGGRYALRHTLDSYGRSHKAGLEIEVYDGYTDKTRWASTLSGGEKFLVALTLSLGLSSVVQSQSGGINIDAIFIDEGFGTLDPYSVEDALNILRDINVSRSMVGIISHVELLKDNIGAAIEVEKKRGGSVLRCNKMRF